jgi:effector-binding domain-containing protein
MRQVIFLPYLPLCIASLFLSFSNDLQADELENSSKVVTKTVPSLRLFSTRKTLSAHEMPERIEVEATRLGVNLVRAGGEKNGPLHMLVKSASADPAEPVDVLIAFPAKGSPRSSGRNRYLKTEPFLCAWVLYQGDAAGLADAWAELARITQAAGYELSGEIRYIFSEGRSDSSSQLSVELQLGLL